MWPKARDDGADDSRGLRARTGADPRGRRGHARRRCDHLPGVLTEGDWRGYADFLHTVRPYFVLQLCPYSELLTGLEGRVLAHVASRMGLGALSEAAVGVPTAQVPSRSGPLGSSRPVDTASCPSSSHRSRARRLSDEDLIDYLRSARTARVADAEGRAEAALARNRTALTSDFEQRPLDTVGAIRGILVFPDADHLPTGD